MEEMIVYLNVFLLGMKDRVLGKLHTTEVVVVYYSRFRHLDLEILQESLGPYGFAYIDNHSSVFELQCLIIFNKRMNKIKMYTKRCLGQFGLLLDL